MPHQPFKSKIIGLGGAGIGALQRLIAEGAGTSDVIAVNTDVQSLSASSAGSKIQLGRRVSRGIGAGGDPELGMAAAEESVDEIRDAVRGCNLVVLVTGLGGGTGSGAAPVIARAIAESGAYVVAIVTMPFHFEGRRRTKQATDALASLRAAAHAVIVFENDRMGEPLGPQAGVGEAFSNADLTISRAALAIISIACRESLIQLSIDEIFRAVALKDSRCLFGFGISNSKQRAIDALEEALSNPLMERGTLLEHCENLIVQVNGGGEMTLLEVQDLMESLGRIIGENTQVLFGLGAVETLGSCVSVFVLGSVLEADYARRRQAAQQSALEERNPRTPAIRPQQAQPSGASAGEVSRVPRQQASQEALHSQPARQASDRPPHPPAPAMRPQAQPHAPRPQPDPHGGAPVSAVPHAPPSRPSALLSDEQDGEGYEEPADLLLNDEEDQRPQEERLERRPLPANKRPAAAQHHPASRNSGGEHTGFLDEPPYATQPAFGRGRPQQRPSQESSQESAHAPTPIGMQNPLAALVKRFSAAPAERKTADQPPVARPSPAPPAPKPPPQQPAQAPVFQEEPPPLLGDQDLMRKGAPRVVRPKSDAPRPKQELFQFDQNSTRGRFEKSDPTIIDGEDLDIPTFMRKSRK